MPQNPDLDINQQSKNQRQIKFGIGRFNRAPKEGNLLMVYRVDFDPPAPQPGQIVKCTIEWSARSLDSFIHLNVFGSWAPEVELNQIYNNRDIFTMPFLVQDFLLTH